MKSQTTGRNRGFTLIELLIVVVVMGILSAIAYPVFLDQMRKSKRSEGRNAIQSLAMKMERYYSQNSCYPSGTAACGNPADSGAAIALVGGQPFSGDTAAKSYYTLAVTLNAQSYTITAIPQLPFADPVCGNLTYQNTQRKWTQSNGSSDDAYVPTGCW